MTLSASLKNATKLKILALHGKGNTGETFKSKIFPFVEATASKVDWLFPTAPYEVDGGYAWWTLPKGVRSFEATSFDGVDRSIKILEDLYPFDIIVGHSQGAMLGAIMLARSAKGISSQSPKYAILSGAAWPNPFGDLIESSSLHKSALMDMKSLHVIGDADDVNPPVMAARVATCLDGEIFRHPGKHILP
eukprot:gene10445-21797_t